MDQEQAEARYICPDCAAEGNAEPQPLSNFYLKRQKPFHNEQGRVIVEYKNDTRRSIKCKRHTNIDNAQWKRRRLDPASPDYDPKAREKLQARQQKYEHEVRKKGGSRYRKRIRSKPKAEE